MADEKHPVPGPQDASTGITRHSRSAERARQARLPQRGARKGERPPPEFERDAEPVEAEGGEPVPEHLGIGKRPDAAHAGTGRARTRDARGGHATPRRGPPESSD